MTDVAMLFLSIPAWGVAIFLLVSAGRARRMEREMRQYNREQREEWMRRQEARHQRIMDKLKRTSEDLAAMRVSG